MRRVCLWTLPVPQAYHSPGRRAPARAASPEGGLACSPARTHKGYITLDEFEQNQAHMAHNRTNSQETLLSGPAREGLALLQGLLVCGRCGRAITIRYQGHGGIYPVYLCSWQRR